MAKYIFPEGFLWGAATAAYQIEGSPSTDDRGESIWDRFSHTPGNTWNEENGDTACEHYSLYREDVKRMAELGLNAYRFSISWPRIFPAGKGKPNLKGLDFYRRLIEELHKYRIKPAVTLYHWDLPQALQEQGGWGSLDTAKYFNQYAAFIFENLDLPVDRWITLNEPWVSAFFGYAMGVHAPGLNDFNTALRAAHNLLLGHGMAIRSFRDVNRENEPIGITLNLNPVQPFSDSKADLAQAVRTDGFMNRWFLDPVFRGAYPQDMVEIFSRSYDLSFIEEEDLTITAEPIDFLGINNYTRILVKAGSSEDDFMGNPYNPPEAEYTEMGWEVYPRGIFDLLVRVHRDYGPLPLYITENGAAYDDKLQNDGRVDDSDRINYLHGYFLEAWKALQEGVPLAGYFVWTLMDNFEWSFGYSKRFGLIYIDYPTQKRYLKDSAYWYRDVISRNGLEVKGGS